jgi:hypothetical protein
MGHASLERGALQSQLVLKVGQVSQSWWHSPNQAVFKEVESSQFLQQAQQLCWKGSRQVMVPQIKSDGRLPKEVMHLHMSESIFELAWQQ